MMMIQVFSLRDIFSSGIFKILLAIAGSTFALVVAVALSILLIRLILRRYRKTLSVEKWVEIANDGNTHSIFRLQATNPQEALVFDFLYKGIKMPYVSLPVEEEEPEVEMIQPVPVSQPAPQHQSAVQEPKTQPQKGKAKASEVKKKSKGAINLGRQFGGILGALGGLLPGSLGASLKEQATTIQGVTQKASDTIEAPEQKKRELQHIQSQTNSMLGKNKKDEKPAHPAMSTAKPAATSTMTAASATPAARAAPAVGAAPVVAANGSNGKKKQRMIRSSLVETPVVTPGDSLRVKLCINPVSIYRTATFPYQIESQQLFSEHNAEPEIVNTFLLEDEIGIKGISTARGALYFFSLLLVLGLNGAWLILFIKWFINIILA